MEGFRERPPDDLMGEGIGNQVQVADSVLRHDVRDIGHPQLVGGRRAEARLQEVLVLAVVVVGIRRVSSVQRLENQMLDMHQVIEAVAPDHDIWAHVLKHQPQLVTADSWTHPAKLMNHANDLRLVQFTLCIRLDLVTVVSPATFPEQPADRLHA